MLAQTTPLSRWQALSTELMAVLDHASAWTDFAPTLELIEDYRAKLVKDIAWAESPYFIGTNEAILHTLLGKWGPNGLSPAVYDCEASARFHGVKECAA